MSGVRAVISGDSPEADLRWRYSRRSSTRLFDPHCRHQGEAVAAVAADTPYQAWDAVRAIQAQYKMLPFVVDEREAREPGAPLVYKKGNAREPQVYERGDVAKGFAEADVVLEETYRTECELHTPMELHGCVARWAGDRLTVWESSQGVFSSQQRIADALELPLAKVRVVGHYMGGGFGSKLWPGKHTLIAAIMARKTGRPVKLFMTREESFLCIGNRPPATMRLKAGVRRDGTLMALEFDGVGSSGAYPSGGTSLLDWLVRDLYLCENVRTTTTDVFINAGPVRPFRAPGHPQGAWALEQMMDALAGAIGKDPVDLRLANIPTFSQARKGHPPYTSTGLEQCLREGARAFGWAEARRREAGDGPVRKGVGVAACLWAYGAGGPPSTIILKVFPDGSANLNMGASDLGTGTKTVMAMVVAEELGIVPERIVVEHADTGTTQYATPSGGSKTVPTESPAVRAAALDVKRQLLDMAAAELEVEAGELRLEGGEFVSRTDPEKMIELTALRVLSRRGVAVGVGYRGPNPEGKVVNPFAAQFCEVEVDTRTGETRIVRFLGAHDSGRVMSRLTYDNQVFGGITMGIGFGMTEARVLDRRHRGTMLNANWHDYKLPTALDVPADMVSLPIEPGDDECNSTGAKGLGEPVTIPTAAAIANAVFDATGVRVTNTPITPARLCRLLADTRKEG